MKTSFSHLAQAGRIGSMTLKNRMVVSAMGVNMGEDGHCGEQVLAYHKRQAEGGVGLIVLGVTGVGWPNGSNQPRQLAISDDKFIPGLRAVADAVHGYGAKIAALGLRVRRARSFHGLAFNIDMDLEPFHRINPCGFEGLEVTQLSDHAAVTLEEAESRLEQRLAVHLGYNDRFREGPGVLP